MNYTIFRGEHNVPNMVQLTVKTDEAVKTVELDTTIPSTLLDAYNGLLTVDSDSHTVIIANNSEEVEVFIATENDVNEVISNKNYNLLGATKKAILETFKNEVLNA